MLTKVLLDIELDLTLNSITLTVLEHILISESIKLQFKMVLLFQMPLESLSTMLSHYSFIVDLMQPLKNVVSQSPMLSITLVDPFLLENLITNTFAHTPMANINLVTASTNRSYIEGLDQI